MTQLYNEEGYRQIAMLGTSTDNPGATVIVNICLREGDSTLHKETITYGREHVPTVREQVTEEAVIADIQAALDRGDSINIRTVKRGTDMGSIPDGTQVSGEFVQQLQALFEQVRPGESVGQYETRGGPDQSLEV